eukprot:6263541-Pyramimonas_sp.AAC.1
MGIKYRGNGPLGSRAKNACLYEARGRVNACSRTHDALSRSGAHFLGIPLRDARNETAMHLRVEKDLTKSNLLQSILECHAIPHADCPTPHGTRRRTGHLSRAADGQHSTQGFNQAFTGGLGAQEVYTENRMMLHIVEVL